MTVDSNHKRKAHKARTADVGLSSANTPGLKTDVKAALEELCAKSAIKLIESQTAAKWLGRARLRLRQRGAGARRTGGQQGRAADQGLPHAGRCPAEGADRDAAAEPS